MGGAFQRPSGSAVPTTPRGAFPRAQSGAAVPSTPIQGPVGAFVPRTPGVAFPQLNVKKQEDEKVHPIGQPQSPGAAAMSPGSVPPMTPVGHVPQTPVILRQGAPAGSVPPVTPAGPP